MSTRALVAALSLLAVVGCGGDGSEALDSTGAVCDEFAQHVKDGQPKGERPEVVRSIGEAVGNADERVKAAHEALVRTATEPDGAYAIAADGFAQACFDSGWEG